MMRDSTSGARAARSAMKRWKWARRAAHDAPGKIYIEDTPWMKMDVTSMLGPGADLTNIGLD